MFAAVGVGQLGLGFCRNGANDRRAEGGRPLNEPGPAGCGVHEDQVTRLDGINLPDQHVAPPTLTEVTTLPLLRACASISLRRSIKTFCWIERR
jgi:hypothetical protein